MTMGLHAGFRLRSVEYAATGYFLFQCKPGWQLTQLSPSTCLVGSFSFPSSPYMQKRTILAVLCSLFPTQMTLLGLTCPAPPA